jgi:phage baseplate assembly protein W
MIDISLDNNLFLYDELDAAIQELDMIFNTENTELIGYPTYGTNWWQYLWELTPLETNIKQYIYDKIAESLFIGNFNPEVEVQHINGTENSIYYIKITLRDKNNEPLTIQQYELK